ncbi:MAG TPA: autotransporter domain-containing protein [Terriglobia bacterium]|nr:autotransporter domain-containing protein [Terriglobia bacterium]
MHIKKVACAVSVALLAMGVASIAHAQTQFGRIVVFGDSLSDGGAYTNIVKALNVPGASQVARFKFTTNPGNVWVDNIAARFGLTLTPNAFDGGSNYAEGGARVTLPNNSQPGVSQSAVSVQIDRFLAAGGTFGKSDVVTMLVGANDIFQGGPAAISPAITALVTQLGRLQAAGANNIVLVSLPDIGTTPAFGFGAGGAANPGTQASASFNAGLKQGLQRFGGNILYIDAFALYREVVANPAAYGIGTVNAVACLTPSSGQCTPATTVPNGAETYLFADSVHPTTAGHRILSDAVIATLLAPSQISMLPLSVQSSVRGQQLAYDNRLYPGGGHPVGKLELYGGTGYTPYKIDSSGQLNGFDTRNADGTIGADYQLSQTGGVGAVLSYTDGRTDFGNSTGSFKSKLVSLGMYGRAGRGPVYTFASGSYGWTSLNELRRDVKINTAVRTEPGSSTSGGAATFKVGAGYDLSFGRWAAGPIGSLNYERIKLDGFSENGASSSTQLTFGAQTLSQLTGSLGAQARLANESAAVLPYVRASYDYDMTYNARSVSIQNQGSVNPFQGAAYLPDRRFFSLTGGAAARLAGKVNITVQASGILGQSHASGFGLTAGVKTAF